MSKSIRIRTTPLGDDKFLKVKIDQDFDFLEILSLKITQDEAYNRYCSDYGVIMGRVVINNGFGIPNAKVSVFIPITEEDKLDPVIFGNYPFTSVYTKNSDGIRYNLLSNQPRPDDECHVAVGTFPTKREVLDCDVKLEIFEKYYKFTTTTNKAGDYMIFGVPVGEHTIHVDVDLSDIGFVSQKPYELISQGYSEKLFASKTQFKTSSNLDVLSQIKSRNSSTSVIPFWGDLDECEIGITRLDFDLNYDVIPTSIFIGSIFGDNDKNSINKRCRPRRKMGLLCESVTNEGTVEIIRKTQEGLIESFSIDGDKLINENGVWCFQIPMNLDKVVTDEFGNLIPSEDPDKGIPTNAKVRFRIGMDETGGEGRLRSRAKFLVPNRTNNYDFDDSTPNSEFADLRWKKIYTVRQFIARYQKHCNSPFCGTKRTFIGIKDVDACGDHLAFPYNRMDTNFDPLFSIICLIVTIVLLILEIINLVLISLLNVIMGILNLILCLICTVIYAIAQFVGAIVGAINSIPGVSINFDPCSWCIGTGCCNCGNLLGYIPCISINCNDESYAPGCYKPCNCNLPSGCSLPCDVQAQGWCHASNGQPPDYYPNDGVCGNPNCNLCGLAGPNQCHGCCGPVPTSTLIPFAGALDCIESQLAAALNLYKFDFYNDWINGTLYAFLFKYKVKVKKNGKKTLEKFCEFDCHENFRSDADFPQHKSNKCRNNLYLVDTCVSGSNNPISYKSNGLDEGVIKEYKDNLYYAAYTHDFSNILYATELSCLGSAVNCDIDGQEKIVDQLVNTSYKLPPESDERDDVTLQVETTGMDPLFFQINCLNAQVCTDNCNNVKKICEIGIGLDEDRTDENPPGLPANCKIDIFNTLTESAEEVEDDLVRNELGRCSTGIFYFDCTNPTQYDEYRGFDQPTSLGLPSKNSYFFYFGIVPGRGALECARNNYFVPCKIDKKNLIPATINVVDNVCFGDNNGNINITLLGGESPYTYYLVDLSSNYYPGTPTTTSSNLLSFVNLFSGPYQLSVTDNNGDNSLYNINVNSPLGLYANVNQITNTTSPILTNGAIDINVSGGIPPYSYTWSPGSYTSQDITNVPAGTYSVSIADSGYLSGCSNTIITLTGITISAPPPLSFTTNVPLYGNLPNQYAVHCYNGNDGQIVVQNISGGTAPYTIYVNGNLTSSSIGGLTGNTAGIPYTITVYDATSAQSSTQIVTLYSPPPLTASLNTLIPTNVLCNGCTTNLTVTPSGGYSPYTYTWNTPNTIQNSGSTVCVKAGTYSCSIKDAFNCTYNITNIVVNEPPALTIDNLMVTNATCYGGTGSTTFSINGGNFPGTYSYGIYNAGPSTTYTPTCNNCASTCNGTACNPGPTSVGCISNPGTPAFTSPFNTFTGPITFNVSNVNLNQQYYLRVQDQSGCQTCTTFTLTSPQQLLGTHIFNQTSISPNKYSVQVSAIGGTSTYSSINLYIGGTCSAPGTLVTPTSSSSNNKTYLNVSVGTYLYKIVDSNNCVYCNTFTLI